MPKKTVVLFENGRVGGRVFINPENVKELSKRGKILINPKIPKGVAPHLWVYSSNGIKTKGGVTAQDKVKPEKPRKSKSNFKYLPIINLVVISLSYDGSIINNLKSAYSYIKEIVEKIL